MRFNSIRKCAWTAAAVLTLAGLMSAPAFASSTTATTFAVTATVNAACTVSATSLPFGTYSGTALKVNSSVTVTCSNSTAYSIGLNAGTTTGATTTNRLMAGPSGATLPYSLYSDTSYSVNWGNTTNAVTGTGNGAAQTLTVYGEIPAGQFPTPGSYSDTVTATVTY